MTVTQAVDRAQVKRPELTDADGITLLNDANREILSQVHLISDLENITNLAVGTRLYDLAATVVKVWWARYQNSATTSDYTILDPVSLDQIETNNPAYLMAGDTTPKRYYIAHKSDGTMQLGLDPAPDTASSGSPAYPRIITRVTRAVALVGGDNLPAGVPTFAAWYKGVIAMWDELNNPDQYPKSYAEYQNEIRKLLRWRQGFNARVNPRIHPNMKYPRRV